jgi:hypothetical protein
MRQALIKYLIGFTTGCILLNIWFMAINAPADFQYIYAALTGALSSILVEGRKQKDGGSRWK